MDTGAPIGPVQLVQVYVVGLQAAQAAVHRGCYCLAIQRGRPATNPGHLPGRPGRLGRDHKVLPAPLPFHVLLGAALRGVKDSARYSAVNSIAALPARSRAHLRRLRIQAPKVRSEAPCVAALCGTGYISALSKKLMPQSSAALSRRWASSLEVPSPNSMVPAHIVGSAWHDAMPLTPDQ